MLQLKKIQTFATSVPTRSVEVPAPPTRTRRCRTVGDNSLPDINRGFPPAGVIGLDTNPRVLPDVHPEREIKELDPLYLFACHVQWEQHEDPGAGWELISATRGPDEDTRAHARALLTSSRHLNGTGLTPSPETSTARKKQAAAEEEMKGPYGLDITDSCMDCSNMNAGAFCEFSHCILPSLDQASHKSTLPAGAILFVEGQASRGIFVVCSGKVNLSTTSREGKILILKSAGPGEALGISASVSGMNYEATAETATPCQVSFVERKHFLELMQLHSEVGVHVAQCLSRDYQSAYRDIHDLVLTRSSSGKLARLLLSQSKKGTHDLEHMPITPMTHEEMAQRIGASRETVTRLLSELRRKQLIRLDGPTLVIRNRSGLEALAV